jgi:sulfotransferase
MKKYEQFVCLSGLPRSGSTLLSAILSQNPKIHAEGNSAVCQLMWDLQVSCKTSCKEQIGANNRENTVTELISKIPEIYYSNIDDNEKIVVDKCRTWTSSDNFELLKKYIDKDIKIIVLERPILEVVNSFCKIYDKNNAEKDLNKFLALNTAPVMSSLNGLLHAKFNNQENHFLFITYDELIENTQETIKKIYDFCGWEYFEHDLNNIVPRYKENDNEYKLYGLHDVYPTIKKSDNTIVLPQEIIDKCNYIDNNMKSLLKNKNETVNPV